MLDIPGAPELDKLALIGGCLKLPLQVDAERLAAEIAALPDALWSTTGGRIGVQRAARAVFLRGFAPAEGDRPIADREVLVHLPYARAVMGLIPAPPQRCLLARMPASSTIAPHVDRAPYFSKTIRIHVPVVTQPEVSMIAGGSCTGCGRAKCGHSTTVRHMPFGMPIRRCRERIGFAITCRAIRC